jgi:hypothetical protein
MYDWGQKGIEDFSHKSNRVVAPTTKLVSGRGLASELRNLPADYDVQGFDLPRQDINQYKSKTGKLVRVGNDAKANRGLFGSFFMPKLNGSFTEKEINAMNLYYEYPDAKIDNNTLGECAYWQSDDGKRNQTKYVVIGVNKKNVRDEATVLHETVHANRFADGIEIRDVDQDEAYVELETIARVSKAGLMRMNAPDMLGYYSYLGAKGWEKLKEDRILLTGSLDRHLTGDAVHQRVKDVFPKSNISKLMIAARKSKKKELPGEWMERYFKVDVPGGDEIEVQMEFKKRSTTPMVVKDLKEKYGRNISIWEWRDGKKFRLTPPKRTTSARKPPARIPVRRKR